MKEFLGEFIGTTILVTLGCGVVAGVLLNKSKSQNAGWLVICLGWGLALMLAIYASGPLSGAHLNPAVSIALVCIGKLNVSLLPTYISGQFLGAIFGACLVYINYLPHWKATEDHGTKLAVFSTGPAIRNTASNFISEFLGSFMLMFGLLFIGSNNFADGLNPVIISLLIVSIGLSLGGTTGWAINPARDLGPRLAHFLLPISGKGSSDWSYAWIPVIAPIAGCVAGAWVHVLIF
jgi:glycerol uptake facilitator protein